MKLLSLVLLLKLVSSELFKSFDQMLSPVNITWPDKWVFNIVELSSNHAGENVSVTVNCKIPEGVPKDAVVLMKILGFPEENHYYIVPETQVPEEDNVFIFTSVPLPDDPGAYGPVTIVVRNFSESAQIHAASYNLQSIAVLPALLKYDPLTVTYSSGATKIVSETTTLKFAFSIQANMNINDYFVLTCDDKYQLSSTITLQWTDGATGTEYFQDMEYIAYKPEKIIVIYGLKVSLSDDVLASFTVSGIINPSYKIKPQNCIWEIKIYRFGTKTTLQKFSGDGPSSVTSGAISSISWLPSNPYLSSENIVVDLVLYMTLEFTISHKIPYDGYIKIGFNNAIINQPLYKVSTGYDDKDNLVESTFIYAEPNNKLLCSIKSINEAKCTVINLSGISAGSINIYNLIQFTGNTDTQIKYLTTYINNSDSTDDTNDDIIDDASDLPIIVYSSNLIIKNILIEFYAKNDDTFSMFTGNVEEYKLLVSLDLDFDTSVEDKVAIVFPFKFASIAEEFTINFLGNCEARVTKTSEIPIKYDEGATDILDVNCDTLSTAVITLSKKYYSDNKLNLFLRSRNENNIAMPIFESSYVSKHEVAIIFAVSQVTYVYSQPLFIYANTVKPDLKFMCLSSSSLGIPANIVYTPVFNYKFTSDYSAYINFIINLPDSYTNLPSESIYPTSSSSSLSDNQVFIEYSLDTPSIITLVYKILSSFDISKENPYSFYLPLPTFGKGGDFTISAFLIFKRNSDSFLFYLSQSDFSTAITLVYSDTKSSTDSGPYDSSSQETMHIEFDSIVPPIIFSAYFGEGYILNNIALIASDATIDLHVFQSKNIEFDLVSSLGFITTGSSLSSLYLNNFITSWIPSDYIITILLLTGSNLNNAATCTEIKYSQQITERNLILTSYSPDSAKLKGADSITINLNISFTLPEILYKTSNTYFKIIVGNDFKMSKVEWSVQAGDFTDSGIFDELFFTTKSISSDLPKDTSINIYLYNVLIPDLELNSDYSGFDEVHAVYNGKNIYSWYESDYIGDIIARTTFIQKTDSSSSSITSVAVFPRTRGSMSVYFYMTFNPQFELPAGTEITIKGLTFDQDPYLSENLWSKYGFTESEITEDGELFFITSYDVPIGVPFLIRKDLAFNISVNEVSPSKAFLVNAKYKNVTILDDAEPEATLTQKLTFTDFSNMILILPSVSASVLNKGEPSWHAFAFKLPINTDSTWSYNFDIPGSYTAFGGPTYTFSDIKDVYFLYSFSTLGNLYCIVEHFLITCKIELVIPAETALDFNILLVNPSESEVYWNFYILDFRTELVFKPLYGVKVQFTDLPENNLDIISIKNDVTAKSLTFLASINEDYTSKSIISIKFPRNYNLDVDYPGIISCSATYYGETTLNLVNKGSLCSIEDNMVKFPIALSFTASNKFLAKFVINGVDRPSGVQIRTDFLDIENSDSYSIYDTWTEKFKLYSVINPESTYISYNSSSYDNLNSAFTGYYNSYKKKITIQNDETLGITGGTYSEKFLISTNSETLAALTVYLTAFDAHSSTLKFSGNGDYILTNNRPFSKFRVGAPSKSPAGFYYIKWTINENPIIQDVYNYDTPSNTLVQLTNTLKIPISISKIPSCIPGYPTLPISLTLDQISPFKGISVKFSRENSTDDYGIRPNPVSFSDSDLVKFFEINCLATLPDSEYKFFISIEGEDKDTFTIDSSKSFTTKSFSAIEVQADPTFVAYNETNIEIQASSNTGAVCTWALIASHLYDTNSSYGTYEYISSVAYPLTSTSKYTQLPLETQVASYESELSGISATTWEDFTMKTLIFADKTFFAGMAYIPQSSTPTQIFYYDRLIANKSYMLIAYFQHPQSTTILNITLTTHTNLLPNVTRIYILFDNDIGQKDDEIQKVLAEYAMISKLRIIEDPGSTRRLASTFYKLILPEAESSYTPMMIAENLNRDTIEKIMQIELNNYDIRIANLQYFETSPELFGIPQFETQFWNTTDKSMILLNFTSNYKGKYCCEVEKDPDLNKTLTSIDILYGYDRSGMINKNSYCKNIDAMTQTTFNVKYTEFIEAGNYVVSCTLCNNYPILPLCLDDVDIKNHTFEKTNPTGFSMVLACKIGFLALLLM
ncbi:hypothetical protein SteCoe_19377 [Stentor coeruleus]|uniref:Uncharacterized protein n=1 Tax=Stentor coeruleus TaxID=5963 RepID=A0A1R2BU88_9CILI|nr:hypothetical protein SteCoe_19377 [Stentor coeruleus]